MKCPFCGSDESPVYHICEAPGAPKATCEGLEPNSVAGTPLPPASVPQFDPTILARPHMMKALAVLGLEAKDRAALESLRDDNFHQGVIFAAGDWSSYPTLAHAYKRLCQPNAIVHDDDGPIMYRWHIVPRNDFAGVYLHVQVRSDSVTRGPHDHEYDSFATILGNHYIDREFFIDDRYNGGPQLREQEPWGTPYAEGAVVRRRAEQLHQIELPEGVPYSMSLFSHGPRRRKWGFANPDGSWVAAEAVGEIVNGTVMAKGRAAT